jgi:short-subunit dehydrogenase
VRVAVITGGSSGIGAALARRLAGSFRCILVARGRERLERVAREVDGEAEVCDVGDRAAVEQLARRVGERYRAVHLLVNNAGVPGRQGFVELPAERIEEVLRINYLGSVWCARAFLALLEAGAPSRVVNVVSVAGAVAGGPSGPYTAAKHAQLAFSRGLGAEVAGRGIRVTTVNPGFTHTGGFRQDRLLNHPVLRHAVVTAERVADAVVDAVHADRGEVFVPGYYRVAAALQGLVPGTVARVAGQALRGPKRPS